MEAKADRARTVWLESSGFRILRFCNSDFLQNLDGVIEAILLALRSEASPPPHPAPIGKSRGRGKIEAGEGRGEGGLQDELAEVGVLGERGHALAHIAGVHGHMLALPVAGTEADLLQQALEHGVQPARADV